MKSPTTFTIIASVVLTACTSSAGQPEPIQEQIALWPNQTVVVEVDTGLVNITGVPGEEIGVGGQLAFPERISYEVSQSATEVRIAVKVRGQFGGFSQPPVRLDIQIPQNAPIKIETFDAQVTIGDYEGDADIASVSGNILAQNVTGKIALRSSRGDVTVRDSSGDIRILGDHGILTIEGVTGKIGSSTIMGTIRFVGQADAGDTIRLETDHGPVEIQLRATSSLSVQVNSISGNMACTLPGLTQDSRSCKGSLGDGAGTLVVRTVSGDVTILCVP
jgi:hypothetical protein